jgi:hypothetical protein
VPDKSIAITGLLAALAPDSRLYLIERRRSRSNESRTVDVLVVDDDRAIQTIGVDVATLAELPWSQELRGLEVRGTPRRAAAMILERIGRELFGADHHLEAEWL